MDFKKFDVIVIGGGAAGLYTALSLSDSLGDQHTSQERDWKIALITKDNLTISASDWAQGGIAAVIDRNDSVNLHIEDTLCAGAGLCEREAV